MSKKDYIRDKEASKELAEKIQNWYHKRGYKSVRVWVEHEKIFNVNGVITNFYVRSNLKFDVASIPNGVLE
jgi:predicted rRNA methylase YqxC with S4 and FtsJ domains